jgi:hypothetical protein
MNEFNQPIQPQGETASPASMPIQLEPVVSAKEMMANRRTHTCQLCGFDACMQGCTPGDAFCCPGRARD